MTGIYAEVRTKFVTIEWNITMKLAILATALVLAGSASYAENRVVTFTNTTSVDVLEIFGSNTGSNTWEEDVLGQDTLEAGQAVDINFDDGTGYCKFDFKVTFADGDEGILADVNVCEVSDVTIG